MGEKMPDEWIELVIEAAEHHGRDSEPDMEIGDLQEALRLAWGLMDARQRTTFSLQPEIENILTNLEGES